MAEQRDDFIIAIRSALLKKGARQRYSLFFLISLSVLVFILDTSSFSYTKVVRSILNDAIYRVSSIASTPLKFTKFSIIKIADLTKIYNENKLLKEQLKKYEILEFDNEFLKIENNSLKKSLKLIDLGSTYYVESHLAKAILDKDSPYLKSIIINKGSKSGFKKGMAVLKEDFLIGRIVEVNFFSSRVLLLNDLNSKIPVTLDPNESQAILEGRGNDLLSLSYLPDGFTEKENETVFTSGKDGVFLPGIPVGKTKINKNGELNIELFADINQLNFVKIIKVIDERRTNFK